MLRKNHIVGLCCAFMMLINVGGASAQDKHAGYYYPIPQTNEVYKARIETLPEATRSARIAFVVALTNQALRAPYPPRYAVFAKGGGG